MLLPKDKTYRRADPNANLSKFNLKRNRFVVKNVNDCATEVTAQADSSMNSLTNIYN